MSMSIDIIWKFNQGCSSIFLLQHHCKKMFFLLCKYMAMSETSICSAFNMHPLMVKSHI